MNGDMEIRIVEFSPRRSTGEPGQHVAAGEEAPATAQQAARASSSVEQDAEPVTGLVIGTWRDSWAFCKASAKALGAYHWVPWLGALAAVLSAVAATQVFTSLQDNAVSVTAQALVGGVAVLATAITALQAWTGSRTKALYEQQHAFHELHRRIERQLATTTSLPKGYAEDVEKQLTAITAGMAHLSNRAWDSAKKDVDADIVWREAHSLLPTLPHAQDAVRGDGAG